MGVKSTIKFNNGVYINGFFSSVGKIEGEGPLGKYFDAVSEDALFGAKSWEQAENNLIKTTVSGAMTKAAVTPDEVDLLFAGDLLNQCTGSSFGLKYFDIPFFGLYGACSTFVESTALAAAMINAGYAKRVVAAASSHFCSSEKQYRFPLEYGGVRTPTSQWTVTGSGAVVLSDKGTGLKVTSMTVGKMVDMGVCDANTMGAAMAPAAADTIYRHFEETGKTPADYDCIVTGDLAAVGSELLIDLLSRKGLDISQKHMDTGSMIFDSQAQGTNAGGSGCGCVASVFCSYFVPKLAKKEIKKILVVATGALMSTTTAQLGEPIIGIAHGITVEI